ncbi:hypothetical protein QBC35DRAFT_90920 [Podospora australis]|uniref:Uncharacterized protein n=1 Tax=Podospora australis TaxID=1536484 RepID=A0AAN6WKS9_9PEZI|nr:hypothetical protein QBC35DRAFT_90920 [Podospora australis]
MNCTLSEICPKEGGDSPLSTTGNITGILTFFLGLVFSFIAFFSLIRNADTELSNLLTIVSDTKNHISQITAHLTKLETRQEPNVRSMQQVLLSTLVSFRQAQQEAEVYLSRFSKGMSFAKRIQWWYLEKETASHMARLESHNQRVVGVQLTLLLLAVRSLRRCFPLIPRV